MIVSVHPNLIEPTTVTQAAELLRQDRLLVLPTDTGYALAGRVGSPAIIEQVYLTKGRDKSKPLHILVANIAMASRYVHLEPRVLHWMEQLMPGPLTLVLPMLAAAPHGLNAAGATLGVRIPKMPFTLAVLEELGEGVTATSANPSGGKAPYLSEDLPACLALPQVSQIFDAGATPYQQPSTIIEVLPGQPPRLLRAGPVPLECFHLGFAR